jgi:hypothetical protein
VKYQKKLPVTKIFLDGDDEKGPLEAGSDDELEAQELEDDEEQERVEYERSLEYLHSMADGT